MSTEAPSIIAQHICIIVKMNQEGRSEGQPPHVHGVIGTDATTKTEEALARARYEQSHPGKSPRHAQPTKSSPWSQPSVQGSMDWTHATSSIDDGESTYSYDSARDLTNYFREIDGRKFSSQASTYMLPAGEWLTMPPIFYVN